MKIGDKVIVVKGILPSETGQTGVIVSDKDTNNITWNCMVKLDRDNSIYGFNLHNLKLANASIIKERLGIK